MKKLSTKNNSKSRYRGTAYKCDLCGRKFMSVDALKTHQRSIHNVQPEKSKVKQYGKQVKKAVIVDKPVKKAAVMEPAVTPIRTTRANPEKVNTTPQTEPPKSTTGTVEFECPKCFKSFPTYILASRHIQKFHCVDKKGGKVAPNSAIIIQPERKELCLKCNRKVKSIPSHICSNAPNKTVEDEGLLYNCTACDTTFNNKRTFYTHVMTLHPDFIESLFFPTNSDFMKWKAEMETQTNTKYSELDKIDSKCYYHCDYQSENGGKASINVCPSVIVIQEFSKGIQVHYYKKHYRHGTKEYRLLNKYKKFSITDFLKSSESYFDLTDIKYDDNDLYVQFKKLMESIVLDAAKLKMDTLTTLFGKALEMTTILTGYDDDLSDDCSKPAKRNITDSQIVKELEEPTLVTENVEEYTNGPDAKKFKNNIDEIEAPSPMILNSFSLADNTIKENKSKVVSTTTETIGIKVKDISTLQATTKPKEPESIKIVNDINVDALKVDIVPTSFNESYADFLEKNFPNEVGKRRSDRRNVVKTKIGQFKPPSPKKSLSTSQDTKVKPVITPTSVPKTTSNNTITTKRKSAPPASPAAQQKQEQEKNKLNTTPAQSKEKKQVNSPAIPTTVPKQELKRKSIRTPIQNSKFSKDSASPVVETKRKPITPIQNSKVIKAKPRTGDKFKVDIEYEVKERDDDCNILILKI